MKYFFKALIFSIFILSLGFIVTKKVFAQSCTGTFSCCGVYSYTPAGCNPDGCGGEAGTCSGGLNNGATCFVGDSTCNSIYGGTCVADSCTVCTGQTCGTTFTFPCNITGDPSDCVSYIPVGTGGCQGELTGNCGWSGTGPYCGDDICQNPTPAGCLSCPQDCSAYCAPVCGDGSCNGSETCGSCASDCGACSGPPAPYCTDGSCNGGENCGNCAADCGSCPANPVCGDAICNGSDTCANCPGDCGSCIAPNYCGNGVCADSETCSNCPGDCGACATGFCGDLLCNGFETCSTCSGDCGVCPQNPAWFQVGGGHLGSANEGNTTLTIQSKISETECVAPNCTPALLAEDRDLTTLTDGFAITGGGFIDANGNISARATNTYALNTTKSRYQERYEYFYRNSGLGNAPTDDFLGQATNALKPVYNAANIAYYTPSDLTIQNPWTVAAGEQYVIFVNGNLTLTDGTGTNDHLMEVTDGGFLAFVVKGNITIDETLGNSTLTSTVSNLEGVYMADGTLTTESRGASAGGDDRFVGEGVFVGWTGVELDRDFSDGGSRALENNDKAAEVFYYRPDLLVNMPQIMLVPIRIWQETN